MSAAIPSRRQPSRFSNGVRSRNRNREPSLRAPTAGGPAAVTAYLGTKPITAPAPGIRRSCPYEFFCIFFMFLGSSSPYPRRYFRALFDASGSPA